MHFLIALYENVFLVITQNCFEHFSSIDNIKDEVNANILI